MAPGNGHGMSAFTCQPWISSKCHVCYFIENVLNFAGLVYARCTYDVIRYWIDDQRECYELEREFAMEWRKQPKCVISRSLLPMPHSSPITFRR